jgi:ABC-2 type transport system ATP-binding protein
MIQVENLTKYYGDRRALHRLSFRVAAGEIVGLVGKNGAGKSTALGILTAQMLPSSGEAFVDGIPVARSPELVRARIGFLPEVAPLYPEMPVHRYLAFAARLRQVPGAEVPARIEAVAKQTGLPEVLGERLGNLSRGYQQRVGIAQALIHRPPVIMLDEPMAGLDPLQIVQIRDLIVSLRPRHTVLFSSHILSEITNVCDRVILIDEGTVKAEGAEAALRRELGQGARISLLVKGSRKRLTEVVDRIAGLQVERLSPADRGTVRAHLVAQGEVREALSRACVGAGLGLLELKGEHDGLEDLFLQVLGQAEGVAS